MNGNLGLLLLRALLDNLPFLFHLLWLPLLLFVAFHGLKYYLAQRERSRLAAMGIADIDALDGKTFEKYLEIRFRQTGYRVTLTPYSCDFGADLILEKAGVKTAVQAKRWKKSVGVSAVQEVVASKAKYGCARALIVTNSTFTTAAVELAACNQVELWERDRLLTELVSIQLGPLKPAVAAPSSAACPSQPTTLSARFNRAVAETPLAPLPSSAAAPLLAQGALGAAFCAECGKHLTPKVESYCRDNAARLDGRMLCYEHQITAGAAMQRSVANR